MRIQIGVHRYGFIRRVDHEGIFAARIIFDFSRYVVFLCGFRAVFGFSFNHVALAENNRKVVRRYRVDRRARIVNEFDKIARSEIFNRRHGGYTALEHRDAARQREFFICERQRRAENPAFPCIQQFRFERAECDRADPVRTFGGADCDLIDEG